MRSAQIRRPVPRIAAEFQSLAQANRKLPGPLGEIARVERRAVGDGDRQAGEAAPANVVIAQGGLAHLAPQVLQGGDRVVERGPHGRLDLEAVDIVEAAHGHAARVRGGAGIVGSDGASRARFGA